jgi:flagellar protein FliT
MEAQILSCYESLSAASGRMLRAARGDDLDGLSAAAADCATTIARLREIGDGVAMSDEGRRRKMAIIRQVLADDAQIRQLTQPWMQRLEALIGGAATQRRLQEAYG